MSRRFPAASSRATPCSISITPRISTAETDANFVMTGSGGLVEVQGTAEGAPFSEAQLLSLLALARGGVAQLIAMQKAAIAA